METLEIVNVDGPNDRGWYDVELSDGRVATTKDKKVFALAENNVGNTVNVNVTERQNGKFTNIYLNGIEVDGEAVDTPKATAPKPKATPQAPTATKQQETQARIVAQWAVGRALEALRDGTLDTLNEVDGDALAKVEQAATSLTILSQKLAAQNG